MSKNFIFSYIDCYFMRFWQIAAELLIVLSLINTHNVLFTYTRKQNVSRIGKSFFFGNSFNIYSFIYVTVFAHQTGIMEAYYLIFIQRCVKNMCIYLQSYLLNYFPNVFILVSEL